MPGPPGIGGENKAQFLRSRNPPHELKEVFTGLVVCPSLGVNILQSWAGVKMALRGVRLGFGGSTLRRKCVRARNRCNSGLRESASRAGHSAAVPQ